MRASCIIRRTTARRGAKPVAEYLETAIPKAKYTRDRSRARVYNYTGDAEYVIRTKLRDGAKSYQWFEAVMLQEGKRK